MKKSNKILLALLGVGAFFILSMIIALKVVVSTYLEKTDHAEGRYIDEKSNEIVSKVYEFKDFNKLKINSSWEITVKQGNEYNIKVSYAKYADGKVRVYQDGKTLKMSVDEMKFNNPKLYAEITMPALDEIDVSGAVDMDISNFTGRSLDIDIAGAGKIEGENSRYDSLRFESAGASNLDFKNVIVKDCRVDISGAGKAEVTMNGGKLYGQISGVGKLDYYGKVSSREIDISGLGKVTHIKE